MKIFKYPIGELLNSTHDGDCVVGTYSIPTPGKILTAQIRNGNPVFWAIVNPKAKSRVQIKIYCVGTGWGDVPPHVQYLTTIQEGAFVWHLFYEIIDA